MAHYILPPDSTGKKIRTRTRIEGADTVHEQAVYTPGADTYYAYADAVVFAQNKQHISIFNGATSGVVLKVRKLFAVNLQTAAITGIVNRFDIKRSTAQSAGTALTVNKADTAEPNLPAAVLVATGATVTEGNLLFPWMTTSEETPATQALNVTQFQQSINVLIEADPLQELTLREGEGFTVKQITASTVGSFGWLAVFTAE